MTLLDKLRRIGDDVARQRELMSQEDEEAAKHVSVTPFIEALGYNVRNLSEVKSQFSADPRGTGGERVDFAIMRDHQPIVLIEAKRAREELSDKYWRQLHDYFGATDVRFGILTNGIEYRFYTDLKKRNIMDKAPFLTIDMLNLDERLVNELEVFTKSGFDPERIIAGARKLLLRSLLEKEFNAPSEEFLRYCARQLSWDDLGTGEMQALAKAVKAALQEFINDEIAMYLSRPEETDDDSRPEEDVADKPEPVPLAPEGVVEVPIFATHKGQRFEATLLVDEIMNWHKKAVMVRFDGELMSSVEAAKKAVRTLNPERKTGKSGLQFWKFIHPVSGEDLPIKVLCDDVQKGGEIRQQLQDYARS